MTHPSSHLVRCLLFAPALVCFLLLPTRAVATQAHNTPPLAQHQGHKASPAAQQTHKHPAHHLSTGAALIQLQKLPPDQREAKLKSDPDFQSLPPERQQKLLATLRKFNAYPPARQKRVVARMRYLETLTAEQRNQLQGVLASWKTLPPDRRRPLKQTYFELQTLAPAEREAQLNSTDFQQRFSPQEQDLLRQTLALSIPSEVFGPPPAVKPAPSKPAAGASPAAH